VFQCVAGCCSVLQCVAVCCSVARLTHALPRNLCISNSSSMRTSSSVTHCNTLQHTATHCNTLAHTAIHSHSTRSPSTKIQMPRFDCVCRCVAVRCSVWQCVAVCCSVFHCVAAVLRFHCLGRCVCVLLYGHVRLGMGVGGAECVLQGAAVCRSGAVLCSVVQCGAVWCSVVQCGAVWCSVVMCSAVCWCAMARV